MMSAEEEAKRLEAVYVLGLLDTAPEQEYAELAELAAEICGVSMSAISLLDSRRQWFKAALGMPGTELDRRITVCTHTIEQRDLLEVEDLREDVRFRENPLVTPDPGLRFYAGIALRAGAEEPVGTLCVADTTPRQLTANQRRGLIILARQVESLFELRARQRALERISHEKDQLTRTLDARNKLFIAFMDHGPFVSYIKDSGGRYQFYNARMRENFGVEGDAWLGRTDAEMLPEETATKLREHDVQVMEGGVPVVLEEHTAGAEGTTLTWRSYKFPILDETDRVMLAGISVDMTTEMAQKAQLEHALSDQRALAQSLAHSHAMMRTLLEHNPNQCYLKSEDGRYLFYNRRFAEHFGITPEKWIGRTDADLVPPELAGQLRAHDLQAFESDTVVESTGEMTNADGTRATFRILKFQCQDQDGSRMLAGIAIDISDELRREHALKEAYVQMEEIASVDALTGLANRRAFDGRLEQEFRHAEATGKHLSLLLVDVDNFKQRNDQWGHAAGDQALRELSRVLDLCCRKRDLAARVGGEEFAVLLLDTAAEAAQSMAVRVLEAVRGMKLEHGSLTVSVGLASINATTRNAAQLYSRADDAMYSAKREGKDRVVVHAAHVQTLLRGVAEGLATRDAAPPATEQPR